MTKWERESLIFQINDYLEALIRTVKNGEGGEEYYRNRIIKEVSRAVSSASK
jgi:hypothetical protein